MAAWRAHPVRTRALPVALQFPSGDVMTVKCVVCPYLECDQRVRALTHFNPLIATLALFGSRN